MKLDTNYACVLCEYRLKLNNIRSLCEFVYSTVY